MHCRCCSSMITTLRKMEMIQARMEIQIFLRQSIFICDNIVLHSLNFPNMHCRRCSSMIGTSRKMEMIQTRMEIQIFFETKCFNLLATIEPESLYSLSFTVSRWLVHRGIYNVYYTWGIYDEDDGESEHDNESDDVVGGYFCSSKLEYEIKVKCLVVLSASQRPQQPVMT